MTLPRFLTARRRRRAMLALVEAYAVRAAAVTRSAGLEANATTVHWQD